MLCGHLGDLHQNLAGLKVRIGAIIEEDGRQEAAERQKGQDAQRIGENRISSGQNRVHLAGVLRSWLVRWSNAFDVQGLITMLNYANITSITTPTIC